MLTELYGGSETLKDTIIAGNSASMEPDYHGGPTSYERRIGAGQVP
jgi:hypothetical protein